MIKLLNRFSAKIYHYDQAVTVAHEIRRSFLKTKPAVLLRDKGRKLYELELQVLKAKHSKNTFLRGVGIRCHMRSRSRKGCQQGASSDFGQANDCDLGCACFLDAPFRDSGSSSPLFGLHLCLQQRNLVFCLCSEAFVALVLWNCRQEFLECYNLLLSRSRLLSLVPLCFRFGREVCWQRASTAVSLSWIRKNLGA